MRPRVDCLAKGRDGISLLGRPSSAENQRELHLGSLARHCSFVCMQSFPTLPTSSLTSTARLMFFFLSFVTAGLYGVSLGLDLDVGLPGLASRDRETSSRI